MCSPFWTVRTSPSDLIMGQTAARQLPSFLLDSKNSCRILPHSSAITPPVMSRKRWFTSELPAMLKTDPQKPVFVSAAP